MTVVNGARQRRPSSREVVNFSRKRFKGALRLTNRHLLHDYLTFEHLLNFNSIEALKQALSSRHRGGGRNSHISLEVRHKASVGDRRMTCEGRLASHSRPRRSIKPWQPSQFTRCAVYFWPTFFSALRNFALTQHAKHVTR